MLRSSVMGLVELCAFLWALQVLWREKNIIFAKFRMAAIVFIVALILAAVLGGTFAAITIIKLMSFGSVLYAARLGRNGAIVFLVALTAINIIVKAVLGDFFTKFNTAPFLLWAACYILWNEGLIKSPRLIIFLAMILEISQAIYVASRGLMLISALVILLIYLPRRFGVSFIRIAARCVPIIYPILMSALLLAYAAGSEYFAPTASNIERSALSFWSIYSMPDFLFVGPGDSVFFENVNSALATAGRERDDDGIDPHSFLLSYWVGLGVFVMGCVYFYWFRFWGNFRNSAETFDYSSYCAICIFSIVGVVPFTLSAPDAFTRLFVGLSIGIACSVSHTKKGKGDL